MRNRPLLLILLSLSSASASASAAHPATRYGTPTSDVRELHRYVASYDGRLRYNRWTLAVLNRDQLKATVDRPTAFLVDPGVPAESRSSAQDFAGYDTGHLEPVNDHRTSDEDARTTMLYSNMAPQLPAFNRGVWRRIEAGVHAYALRPDVRRLYVCTIPLFVARNGRLSIDVVGPNQVPVPTHFAKAVLVEYQDGRIQLGAFVIPHRKSADELWKFGVTTDELEATCGFDLWNALEDGLEARLEAEQPARPK